MLYIYTAVLSAKSPDSSTEELVMDKKDFPMFKFKSKWLVILSGIPVLWCRLVLIGLMAFVIQNLLQYVLYMNNHLSIAWQKSKHTKNQDM